jgi:hypothetical protein
MKHLVFPDQTIHEADEHGTSKVNGFSGTLSQQCIFGRIGSVRVRTLPSVPENNETVSNAYYLAVA